MEMRREGFRYLWKRCLYLEGIKVDELMCQFRMNTICLKEFKVSAFLEVALPPKNEREHEGRKWEVDGGKKKACQDSEAKRSLIILACDCPRTVAMISAKTSQKFLLQIFRTLFLLLMQKWFQSCLSVSAKINRDIIVSLIPTQAPTHTISSLVDSKHLITISLLHT